MHLAKSIDANIMGSELVGSWGTTVSATDFKRMLNDILGQYDARAVIKRQSLKNTRVMRISGSYSFFRKKMKKIDIVYHLDHGCKGIKLNTRLLNRVIFLTSQTLQHELIHKAQYKKFGDTFYTKHISVFYSPYVQKKREENIKYLSLREEVDCFAQNIAVELVYRYPNKTPLELFKGIDKCKCTLYNKYKLVFKNTEWEDLKKVLLKKIWKWLPKVSAPPRLTAS